jgi:hypothetical protein
MNVRCTLQLERNCPPLQNLCTKPKKKDYMASPSKASTMKPKPLIVLLLSFQTAKIHELTSMHSAQSND